MKNRVWINLVMAVLVAGLFLTVSCSKTKLAPQEATIESKDSVEAQTKSAGSSTDSAVSQSDLDDQAAAAAALEAAKAQAAKKRFQDKDIHFEYDSSQLSSMAKFLIKDKADWLKANAGVSVTIEGHCDERGTTDYNLALGERRAAAVKAYLVNLGVAASRLNTISYGEEKPVDMGKTEASYRKNRRAHFSVD